MRGYAMSLALAALAAGLLCLPSPAARAGAPRSGDRDRSPRRARGFRSLSPPKRSSSPQASIAGTLKLAGTDRITVAHAPRADFQAGNVARAAITDAAVISSWLAALARIPAKGPGIRKEMPAGTPEGRIRFFKSRRRLAALRMRAGMLDAPAGAGWDFYAGADAAFTGLVSSALAGCSASGALSPEEIEEAIASDDPLQRIRGWAARIADHRISELDRLLAYARRGLAYLETGRPRKAIADLDRALDIDPAADFRIYSLRGLARFAAGRYAEAAEDFDAGCGTKDEDGGFTPRVWGHISRLRAGKPHQNVLASYLESRLVEDTGRPRRVCWRGGCRVVWRVGWRSSPVSFRQMPDAERRLAGLFLGRCSPDEYFEALQPAIDAVPAPVDPEDPVLKKEHDEQVHRLSALRALYMGEHYLLRGKKKLAEKWLARAADFAGRPDAHWPLVGAGSLARYELKRLRGKG